MAKRSAKKKTQPKGKAKKGRAAKASARTTKNKAVETSESSAANLPIPASPPGSLASTDPLQRYLWEVRQYPLLSREEELELATLYKETGDPDAAAKLATANLRLVIKIAMDHQHYWTKNLLDLIQEGNIGLLQAVKKFDPFRGIKFSYYASFWIKAYILKFIMDNWRLVKLGTTQAQRKLFYNLRKEKDALISQGISPEPKLLSAKLGVSEKDVVNMSQRLNSWEVSLDQPVQDDADTAKSNFLPDETPSAEDTLAVSELKQIFHDQLMTFRETLDDKEKDIFDKRLIAESPMTLNELGELHGISRERIRQLQVRLMEKLGDYLRENIDDFDGQFAGLTNQES